MPILPTAGEQNKPLAAPDAPLVKDLPEDLARIKDQLLAGKVIASYQVPSVEGYAALVVYDTGHEPDAEVAHDDHAIVKLTKSDSTVLYAKVNYYFRLKEIRDITLISENEASEFIEQEREYHKSYKE